MMLTVEVRVAMVVGVVVDMMFASAFSGGLSPQTQSNSVPACIIIVN